MTTFIDGPASGQTLMLKRTPVFLRVVYDKAADKWDALNLPEDKPKPSEEVFAYQITNLPGNCHVNMLGGRGGFFSMAEYKLCERQPIRTAGRVTELWMAWCMSNTCLVPAELKKETQ